MVEKQPQKRIIVIKKASNILKSLSIKGGRTLNEISKITGMSRPTVYTILKSLEDEEFIWQDPSTKKYRLGLSLMSLGSFAMEDNDLRSISFSVMEELRQKSGECVYLNINSQNQRVCIESLDSLYDLKINCEVGQRSELFCGASARVFLAYLKNEEINNILGNRKEFPLEGGGFITRQKLWDELEKIRRQGYSLSSSERAAGSSAVSAPITGRDGAVVASLSICIPDSRFGPEKVLELTELVLQGSHRISCLLGYEDEKRKKVGF